MEISEVFKLAEKKGFKSHIECIDYRALPDTDMLTLLFLTQIQKELRDNHGIHVQPQKTFHNKTYIIGKIPTEFRILGKGLDDHYNIPSSYINAPKTKFETYKQALQEGIYTALKILPDKTP